ncbi:M1-specific T cell receptor alpha chain-like [Gymnodraco acuticeps]|uniref:M1-specific T cell receptor alpha chain-like n=1 Tax=Gymnodraco acuticeps TaxID=8218 RepID=UPI0014714CD4|nr:M1-specific T cell receptor alpha chain-like [Gymnodraco acuticeps]
MEHWLWIILAALSFECKGQDTVTQTTGEVSATEGDTVTIDCTFKTTDKYPYLFWYKQEVNGYPKYMLMRWTGTGENAVEFQKDRFDATINETSVPLQISSAAVTDSAVYYCALRPNTGGYKMIFGRGTRVTVETKEEYEPSFYKLEAEPTPLCLATGFSRIRAADQDKSDIFNNRAGAVRIEGDSLFNQVGYLSSNQTCETGGGPGDCDDSLQPDPQVNLASLTVLGLRLLFMKTVVFNVLLTLRLWITS